MHNIVELDQNEISFISGCSSLFVYVIGAVAGLFVANLEIERSFYTNLSFLSYHDKMFSGSINPLVVSVAKRTLAQCFAAGLGGLMFNAVVNKIFAGTTEKTTLKDILKEL